MKTIKGYKGFDKNWKCRGYQFEVGKKYTHEGDVEACKSGFHFCENPLDVFNYYSPAESVFAEVEGSGKIDTHEIDSKIACSTLKVNAEISLHSLVEDGVKFILEKVDFKNAKESNTGYKSAATNTGYKSAASNTGNYSAASNTGNYSAATVGGKESVAMAIGFESRAKGGKGCWLVLSEWEKNKGGYHIGDVQCIRVDGKKIKADTFYMLKDGKFVEYED